MGVCTKQLPSSLPDYVSNPSTWENWCGLPSSTGFQVISICRTEREEEEGKGRDLPAMAGSWLDPLVGDVALARSGSRIPFWMSSSRCALIDIFLSNATTSTNIEKSNNKKKLKNTKRSRRSGKNNRRSSPTLNRIDCPR